MRILAIKKGYIQLDEVSKEIIDWKDGLPYEMTVNNKPVVVGIIPIGGIVIYSYNQNLDNYLAAGGSVKEMLRVHKAKKIPLTTVQKDGTAISNQLIMPLWITSGRPQKEYSFDFDMDFDLPILQVTFVKFQGDRVPCFLVEKISDLYFYDLQRMTDAGIRVRECVECGKAFVGNTTSTCCSRKCKNKRDNRQRQERVNNQPGKSIIYQIGNTVRSRRLAIYDDDYTPDEKKFRELYNGDESGEGLILSYMKEKIKTISGDDLYKFAKSLRDIDWNFWRMNNYIMSKSFCGFRDKDKSIDLWQKERVFVFEKDDPEQWLKSWFDAIDDKEWESKADRSREKE